MEDPRTKANAFRVPPYYSKEVDTMLSVGIHTIKDMKITLAAIVDSLPPTQAKTKKSRHRRHHGIKSKATIGSDSSDSADEKSSKTVDGQGLKNSSKSRPQSSEKIHLTIVTDSSLLMPEVMTSSQTEHDVRH